MKIKPNPDTNLARFSLTTFDEFKDEMKSTQIFSIIILFVSWSCSEENLPLEDEMILEGSWTLVNINGGLQGLDEHVAKGEVLWSFTAETGTVMITNNYQGEETIASPASGEYPFEMSAFETGQETLFIDGVNVGVVERNGEELSVDQRAFDGFQLLFGRYDN